MRILMILLAWLSLSAEDAELSRLRNEQLRLADDVRRYGAELARAATEAGFSVPAELFERMRLRYDDLIAQAGTGQVPTVDADTAKASLSRTRDLAQGATQLTGLLSQFGYNTRNNFLRTPVQPDPQQHYREQMAELLSGWATSLATEGRFAQLSLSEALRWHQLRVAISLLRHELLIRDGQMQVPPGEAPANECIAWCRAARARMDAALEQPPAAGDEQESQRRTQAYDLVDKRLDLWRALVYAVGRRRATTQPPFSDADGPGLPALRVSLDRQVELSRALLAIYADQDALSFQAYEEIDRLRSESNHLEEAESSAMNAITWQRDFVRTRQSFMEQLTTCTQETRHEVTRHLDQIAVDMKAGQTRQLTALIGHDRVATAEALCDQELVKVRLDALGAEVVNAVWLAEMETLGRAQAQDPALLGVTRRFHELREKLGEALAKQAQILVAQQQVRNRITMLQLKEELTAAQVGNAEAEVQRLRDDLGEVRLDLDQAGERAKEAKEAKDAKDAERILLVQPGADNF